MSERKFDMGDYVDVAHRIAEFREKFPDGSLRPVDPAKPYEVRDIAGKTFIVYAAAAYRRPDDSLPGIGLAWEPFPGATPYTRNSELQNAETSAWGRAIMAALAADARKGIASAEEVRNRAHEPDEPSRPAHAPSSRPGAVSAPATGNGAPPATGAAEGVPPCPQCGGRAITNPKHAENPRAPDFKCNNGCTEDYKGKPYPMGFYAASEKALTAARAQLGVLSKDMQARGVSADEATRRIHEWYAAIGVPETSRLWAEKHCMKVLDTLKGADFILEQLAPMREPGADDDVGF